MNSFFQHSDATERDLLDQLALAQSLIAADEIEAASTTYRSLLSQSELQNHRHLHAEVLANLAALLLHKGDAAALSEAIDMLVQSQSLRDSRSDTPAAIADTNLALAYIRRFQETGNRADAFIAHITLDGVETMLSDPADRGTLDWVKSVRDLLVEALERRSAPRSP